MWVAFLENFSLYTHPSPASQQTPLFFEARLCGEPLEFSDILPQSLSFDEGFFFPLSSPPSPVYLHYFEGWDFSILNFCEGSFHMVGFSVVVCLFSVCPTLYLKGYQESHNKLLPHVQWKEHPPRCFSAHTFWGKPADPKENVWVWLFLQSWKMNPKRCA